MEPSGVTAGWSDEPQSDTDLWRAAQAVPGRARADAPRGGARPAAAARGLPAARGAGALCAPAGRAGPSRACADGGAGTPRAARLRLAGAPAARAGRRTHRAAAHLDPVARAGAPS